MFLRFLFGTSPVLTTTTVLPISNYVLLQMFAEWVSIAGPRWHFDPTERSPQVQKLDTSVKFIHTRALMFQCWIDCGSANVAKHSSSIGTDRMRGLCSNRMTWNGCVPALWSVYFVWLQKEQSLVQRRNQDQHNYIIAVCSMAQL